MIFPPVILGSTAEWRRGGALELWLPLAEKPRGDVRPRRQSEFIEDVAQVILRCALSDCEALRNLQVRQTLSDQFCDLEFARPSAISGVSIGGAGVLEHHDGGQRALIQTHRRRTGRLAAGGSTNDKLGWQANAL